MNSQNKKEGLESIGISLNKKLITISNDELRNLLIDIMIKQQQRQ